MNMSYIDIVICPQERTMTAIQNEKKKFDFIPMCQLCEIEFASRNESYRTSLSHNVSQRDNLMCHRATRQCGYQVFARNPQRALKSAKEPLNLMYPQTRP